MTREPSPMLVQRAIAVERGPRLFHGSRVEWFFFHGSLPARERQRSLESDEALVEPVQPGELGRGVLLLAALRGSGSRAREQWRAGDEDVDPEHGDRMRHGRNHADQAGQREPQASTVELAPDSSARATAAPRALSRAAHEWRCSSSASTASHRRQRSRNA